MSVFTRRKLLSGLGAGTALFSNLLRRSVAQAAGEGNFFMFATPNGFVRSKFGGTGTGSSWNLASSLTGLAPYKDSLITIRGLNHKSSSTFNSHEDMCKIMTFVHGEGNKETVYGRSFDHEVGAFLNSKPLTLGVPPQLEFVYTRVSWVGPQKPDPKIYSPMEAYVSAFGSTGTVGPSTNAAKLLLAQRKSAVDLVAKEATTFCNRLAGANKENCELYLENIHRLGQRLSETKGGTGLTCVPTEAKKSADLAEAFKGQPIDKFRMVGDALLEVAATALACGVRRTGSIIWQQDSGGFNPTNGGDGGYNHHAVTHANDFPTWEKIDKWYADRFGRFIGKLSELGALDNTVVVWGSGISEEHNQCDECVVIAGGKALGIRSNQNIRYPWVGADTRNLFQTAALAAARNSANASLADLYVSIQKAIGLRSETVGDAKYCTGGLKDVFAG
jgi:hypothetical protein